MTFEEAEEAINKKKYVDSAFGREKLQLAIELMKVDAMQRQADAIEKFNSLFGFATHLLKNMIVVKIRE